MANFRKEKIAELIHRQVGKIIDEEIDWGETLVTISRVILSANGQQATVHFSVFPHEAAPEVSEQLEKNIYHIQQILNKQLEMRPVPKLTFKFDESEQKGRELLDLIDKVEE